MCTRLARLVGPFALCFLVPSAAAQDWSNLGGNAGRNGLTSAPGPTLPTSLWSDTSSPAIRSWAPFTEGSRVFTVRQSGFPTNGGAANDEIVALDLATGVELWSVTLPFGGDISTEWIAWIGGVRDGRLIASRSGPGRFAALRALDAATGALLWTSTVSTEASASDGVVFAPDGDPVVGDDLRVVRIDALTGAAVWTATRYRAVHQSCGAAATSTAAFIDDVVPGGQVITKLDLTTGARLYSSPVMFGFTEQTTPFLSPDGLTVYFARTQGDANYDALYAFEDTGTALVLKWSRPVRFTAFHDHGIGADGSIYTFLVGEEFVRLDPATGNVTASAGALAPTSTTFISPKTAIGGDGTVYLSCGWIGTPPTVRRTWAFTADLATQLFVLQLVDQEHGGPALAHDGTLVLCDRTGVHAFRAPGLGAYCAGDGSGAPCPCGNAGDALHGCGNGSFAGGCALASQGQASVGSDTLVLVASQASPNQPGLFFQGDLALNGGDGLVFGDGLRCAGNNVVRLQTIAADANGAAMSSVSIASVAGLAPGDTRRYQLWYRDPTLSPCGTGFNLSNGLELVWGS